MITKEDMLLVIDKSKIRRKKQKARKILEEVESVAVVKAIYFDGLKNNTIVQEEVGARMYRRVVKEEHISIIHDPDEEFIGRITPMNETGAEITKCIFYHLKEKQFDTSQISVRGQSSFAIINYDYATVVLRRNPRNEHIVMEFTAIKYFATVLTASQTNISGN
ncbi:hypothetical protein ILUMI_27424 [Ignelater luminosus]|uniref:Uncharacterized protein n=1 Tax=Ignelater luminosus TaxID=2038154 RepID=A0A8K0C4K9_IGNLU|nr:hypothetical protein ILUMI_27424 [Ignelater luminosus]